MKLAENECVVCKRTWKDYPGSWAKVRTKTGVDLQGNEIWDALCPDCGSRYWRWTNYNEKDFKVP